MAAADHPDPPEVSTEIEALLHTVEVYKRDNQRLQAEIAELRHKSTDDDQPRPLKSLTASDAEYTAARRARRAGLLRAERKGGRWYSTVAAIRDWRAGR